MSLCSRSSKELKEIGFQGAQVGPWKALIMSPVQHELKMFFFFFPTHLTPSSHQRLSIFPSLHCWQT